MTSQSSKFQSYFKVNGRPIAPPMVVIYKTMNFIEIK